MISVGFDVVADAEGVRSRTFADPPELAARMMSSTRRGPLSLLLLGRIYYRPAGPFESDAALAAMLYEQGGLAALERLEGDFVLAAYDASTRRIVALRSPSGVYPLFWTQSGAAFAAGTSIRTLVDGNVRFDDEYLAEFLAYPIGSLMEVPTERTAYRGVQRLLPGWSLEMNLETRHAAVRKAWDWAAHIERTKASSIEEAGALVRDRLEGAVRERLGRHGATACHFSGGMDSTAIALLAERLLVTRGQQVQALTHVYFNDPVLAQEHAYLGYALRGRRALRHHPIPSDDLLRWDESGDATPLDEPATGAMFWRRASVLADAAARAGADTIMGGDGADQLFFHPPPVLAAEALRRGRLLHALRIVREHTAASNGSPWNELRAALQFVLPLRRPVLQVPPWFTRDYARQQRLAERTRASRLAYVAGRAFSAADLSARSGDWFNWNIGAPRGILMTSPFYDTRVVSLVLGLPSHFHEPPRPRKPLLAAAMRGILPDELLRRGRKAHFGALLAGYARNRARLERLVDEAPIDDAMIDRKALLAAIDRAALGMYGDVMVLGRLDITLAYLDWVGGRGAWMERAPRYLNEGPGAVSANSPASGSRVPPRQC